MVFFTIYCALCGMPPESISAMDELDEPWDQAWEQIRSRHDMAWMSDLCVVLKDKVVTKDIRYNGQGKALWGQTTVDVSGWQSQSEWGFLLHKNCYQVIKSPPAQILFSSMLHGGSVRKHGKYQRTHREVSRVKFPDFQLQDPELVAMATHQLTLPAQWHLDDPLKSDKHARFIEQHSPLRKRVKKKSPALRRKGLKYVPKNSTRCQCWLSDGKRKCRRRVAKGSPSQCCWEHEAA